MIPIRNKGGNSPRSSKQATREAPASRVVPKPVPERQVKDARGYQIEQLRRRFSPTESEHENGDTILLFNLAPSDPDFPFDLDHLDVDLRVPAAYPRAPPQLLVRNTDIPRGFAINIEKGWAKLVEEKKGATLLALTNALDKNLESFLSEQKAETVKLMTFKDTKPEPAPIEPVAPPTPPVVRKSYIPLESFTRDQIAEAKGRRAQEVRQLEARMGKLPAYQRSSDGIIYTLPLEPKRRAQLPVGLQGVNSVQLVIPLLYPLQPLRVLLNEAEPEDAEPIEELFSQTAMERKEMTLTSHINYLAQNLHSLAKEAHKPLPVNVPAVEHLADPKTEAKEAEHSSTLDGAKTHIHVIPRPPEWHVGDGDESDDTDEDYSEDEDEDEGGVAVDAEAANANIPTQTSETGVAISFPSIELHGIELLQISILNLSVKCNRCKTLNDINSLTPNTPKSSSCKKCATPFSLTFRPELIHANSTRAGFVDASACTIADLLPSSFIPTCSSCSTPSSQPLLSVRGDTTTNVCRTCHHRFTFSLPTVKFLSYAPGANSLPPPSAPRRRLEKLGLHPGEPLPDRGACAHYRKSNRWFRFSCCSKVYPCDKCHDAEEQHEMEWASRMICGYCSREQRYAVESCAFCGRSVIGKRGKGYWEGGKGTRDRVLMRRGDKRKHRRLGGTATSGKKKEDQ
ncbi:hypothetical protein QBC34DRAFT_394151 [Podospora aff. communis PSN243]|uniref:CHY-type domain-containing protein n=1 Tax=Podospora aff. communis PSN243 TaxID=3040156 RepID=A0AAV9H152_9PEZI|nr:hypothetical protein QBC34DRAFT_394151 [Podospora aff. communis PSN243]